jgi:hypothetical protein
MKPPPRRRPERAVTPEIMLDGTAMRLHLRGGRRFETAVPVAITRDDRLEIHFPPLRVRLSRGQNVIWDMDERGQFTVKAP